MDRNYAGVQHGGMARRAGGRNEAGGRPGAAAGLARACKGASKSYMTLAQIQEPCPGVRRAHPSFGFWLTPL